MITLTKIDFVHSGFVDKMPVLDEKSLLLGLCHQLKHISDTVYVETHHGVPRLRFVKLDIIIFVTQGVPMMRPYYSGRVSIDQFGPLDTTSVIELVNDRYTFMGELD